MKQLEWLFRTKQTSDNDNDNDSDGSAVSYETREVVVKVSHLLHESHRRGGEVFQTRSGRIVSGHVIEARDGTRYDLRRPDQASRAIKALGLAVVGVEGELSVTSLQRLPIPDTDPAKIRPWILEVRYAGIWKAASRQPKTLRAALNMAKNCPAYQVVRRHGLGLLYDPIDPVAALAALDRAESVSAPAPAPAKVRPPAPPVRVEDGVRVFRKEPTPKPAPKPVSLSEG